MSFGLSVGALAGGFAEGHTAACFSELHLGELRPPSHWGGGLFQTSGGEQLLSWSKRAALPFQEVNLQLAGFRGGGRGGAAVPACVHCGRGLCTSPCSIPPATARNQQVH